MDSFLHYRCVFNTFKNTARTDQVNYPKSITFPDIKKYASLYKIEISQVFLCSLLVVALAFRKFYLLFQNFNNLLDFIVYLPFSSKTFILYSRKRNFFKVLLLQYS